jgi:metallo-beta-lactamase class B
MFRLLLAVLLASVVSAQQENWSKPFPAHRIAGNIHYVGTMDLACFLITTPQGHLLINTGLPDSVPLIRAGIQKLGYKLEDVKILLTMQSHFDHVSGFAEVQRLSGAAAYITEPDVPSIEDGCKSDPVLNDRWTPVRVARKLRDGDVVGLGGSELLVHLTPGHSKGSVSYSTTVQEAGKTYHVLFANMATVVMPLVNNAKYPNIADDFATTFRTQKRLSPDIWLAAHASQYRMEQKYRAGSFVDPQGYKRAVHYYEKEYLDRLARERGGH